MKILLIRPPWLRDGIFENIRLLKIPPLSLGIIAALSDGHEVVISDGDVEEIPYHDEWDLVGITATSSGIISAYEIADKFRSLNVKVVMGGVHVSLLKEEALSHADSIVVGEVESVWAKVLSDFPKLENIYYGGTLDDMDRIPVPRRDLFHPGYIAAPVQITRGCVNKCEYCYLQDLPWKKYRKRSHDLIEKEISEIKEKFLIVVDDNLFVDREYVLELARRIKPYKKLWCTQAPLSLGEDRELLSELSASGLYGVNMGIDSAFQKTLESVSKTQNDLSKLDQIVKNFHDYSIGVIGYFVFGFEGETKGTFDTTMSIIRRSDLDGGVFFVLTPSPMSRLYNDLNARGRILSKDWRLYGGENAVFKPSGMSKEELETGTSQMYEKVKRQNLKHFYKKIPLGLRMFMRSPRLAYYLKDNFFMNTGK